jgi:GT2 family glycosyltransferase
MTPQAAVLIVAHNAGAHLQWCVDALAAQTLQAFEVIVVDNASTDGAVAALSLPDDRFRVVDAGGNLGFAAANNLGARLTTAPLLVCLNPDAFAAPDWLAHLVAGAQSHPDVVMFGSTQIMANDPTRYDGIGDRYHISGVAWRGGYGHPVGPVRDVPVFGPCAAAALYRRTAFDAVGGFDDAFFCYHEDVDLAFRLRLVGGLGMQVPEAVVRHVGSASAGKGSDFAVFYGTRNRVWTYVKNMPGWAFWLFLPAHVLANLLYLMVQTARGRGASTVRGLWAALAGLPRVWRQRQAIQARCTVPVHGVLAAMVWNPLYALRRR